MLIIVVISQIKTSTVYNIYVYVSEKETYSQSKWKTFDIYITR